MNTLTYLSLNDVADKIRAGQTIQDGTVIMAPAGAIEHSRVWPDVTLVEQHVGSSDWKIRHGDNVYNYQLLVARQGVEDLRDSNGDVRGFRVVGTERQYAV